jgi:hypothetical protein
MEMRRQGRQIQPSLRQQAIEDIVNGFTSRILFEMYCGSHHILHCKAAHERKEPQKTFDGFR